VVEHDRVVEAAGLRLLLRDDRVEVVERLDVRAERAGRLAHDRADQDPQRIRPEHGRERIRRHDQRRPLAPPRVDTRSADAARQERPHVRVLQPRTQDDLADHREQLLRVEGQLELQAARRALEAGQVVARPEQVAAEHAHPLEDAVAVEEAVVEDGDAGVGAVDVVAVDVDRQPCRIERHVIASLCRSSRVG
jgi:hypothetical protein